MANIQSIITNGNGNVLIGTTTDSGYKLDVNGSARVASANGLVVSGFNTDTGLRLDYGNASGQISVINLIANGVTNGYIGLQMVDSSNGDMWFGSRPAGRTMTIYRDGNVGIGTTAPNAKLEVNGSAKIDTWEIDSYAVNNAWLAENVYFDGSNFRYRANGYAMLLYSDAGSGFQLRMSTGTGGAGDVISTATNLSIKPNGNVQIGTTTDSGYKLQVNGTGYFADDLTVNSNIHLTANNSYININRATTNSDGLLIYKTGGSNRWLLGAWGNSNNTFYLYSYGVGGSVVAVDYSTGNVGIGMTSPDSVLDVNYKDSNTNIIRVSNGSGSYRLRVDQNFDMFMTNASFVDTVGIYNNGNAFFSGNVGIGTTSPTEKLHVDGNVIVTYNNSYQGINSVGNKAILARVSPTTGIINYAEYATAANLNGFVMGSDDARVKGNIATDSLEFITNGSTRMTVLSSGYVGVNTTTPGTNFHVVGDVLIQTGALGVGVNPNATDGRIDASNDIVAYSSSDRRLKENITPIANALDKVKSLTGVEFDWKPEHKKAHGYEGRDTGVIAQEVQGVMPTAVRTNDTGYLAVRYEKMIGLLIEAMKEQQTQIDELKAKLDGLTK